MKVNPHQNMNIAKTEQNLAAATEILECMLRVPGARVPHNPCIMFEPGNQFGTLQLRSTLMGRNDGDVELISAFDRLGDGWTVADGAMLIDWLNENCQPE